MAIEGLHIGTQQIWGGETPLVLSRRDRRRHLYMVGQTGVGKSTLLHRLIAQDIAAGEGIALIDPHGDLAVDVCSSIPSNRIDDVVIIDPSDAEFVVALNPFYRVPADLRPLYAANLVTSLRGVWSDSWGPRLEYILRNTVALVLDAPDELRPSFLSIPRVLVERPYRQALLKRCTDYRVVSFFRDEFDTWNDRQVAEALSSVQNKIGEVISNPYIRNILGQWRPTIDLGRIIRERKILILRVGKGAIGASQANLLGSFVVSGLLQQAMYAMRPENRTAFHLYIDEFQNFTTDEFATILSEARKYELTLTTSNQFISQLARPIADAIFGNVGNIIAFRVGAEDADRLAHEFGDRSAVQFRDLARGELIAQLTANGEVTPSILGRSLLCERQCWQHDKVIAKSRRAFTRPRATAEKNINRWLGL